MLPVRTRNTFRIRGPLAENVCARQSITAARWLAPTFRRQLTGPYGARFVGFVGCGVPPGSLERCPSPSGDHASHGFLLWSADILATCRRTRRATPFCRGWFCL